jgi:hypothetical protein
MDNSCSPGSLGMCAFSSAEVNTSVTQTSFQPGTDLQVSRQVPVGALYAWRVRACDGADRCSGFSAPAYLHVGRTPQALNGDGFAEVVVTSGAGIAAGADIYLGSASFNPQADFRIVTGLSYSLRHGGDLNGDDFGDLVLIGTDFETCGTNGSYPKVLLGGPNLASMQQQSACGAAGSSSVTFQTGHVGDLDGDGYADLGLTREFQDSRFLILRGGSAVQSVPEIDIDITLEGAEGTYPHVSGDRTFDGGGDFNRDGYADVIVAGRGITPPYIRTRLYRGAPALARNMTTSFDLPLTLPDPGPLVTRIGDLDQDGRDDWALGLSVGNTSAGSVAVVSGAAGLPTRFSRTIGLPSPLVSLSRMIDFDRNGEAEVFVAPNPGALLLLRNTGAPVETPVNSQLNASVRLASADQNGDGREDLLLNSTGTGNFTVRWVAAAASFSVTPIALQPFNAADANVARSIIY